MPELIFIHIPKTGGISFLQTLNEVYGERNVKQIWELLPYPGDWSHERDSPMFQNHAEFRRTVNKHLQDVSYPVIFGHMPVWVLEDLWPGVPRVTWLRNPLDQTLSRIFHFRKMRLLNAQEREPWALAREPVFRNCQFFYTGGSLRQFAFTGILEDYDYYLECLGWKFNWPQVEPHHIHPTQFEDDKRKALRNNPDFVREMREINALDHMIYDWASAL